MESIVSAATEIKIVTSVPFIGVATPTTSFEVSVWVVEWVVVWVVSFSWIDSVMEDTARVEDCKFGLCAVTRKVGVRLSVGGGVIVMIIESACRDSDESSESIEKICA